jgi:hypothetical protein
VAVPALGQMDELDVFRPRSARLRAAGAPRYPMWNAPAAALVGPLRGVLLRASRAAEDKRFEMDVIVQTTRGSWEYAGRRGRRRVDGRTLVAGETHNG